MNDISLIKWEVEDLEGCIDVVDFIKKQLHDSHHRRIKVYA